MSARFRSKLGVAPVVVMAILAVSPYTVLAQQPAPGAPAAAGAAATARAIGDADAAEAASAEAVASATKATEQWLLLLDGGNFGDSWKGAAQVFKLGVSESDWVSEFATMHTRLGKTTMRELKSAQFSTTLRGAPSQGEYVTMSFLTKYANAPVATETIVATKEADGQWRIAGYNISKAPE